MMPMRTMMAMLVATSASLSWRNVAADVEVSSPSSSLGLLAGLSSMWSEWASEAP